MIIYKTYDVDEGQIERSLYFSSIIFVGESFDISSIPFRPGFAFTSRQYGSSFSLSSEGSKSTPTNLPRNSSAILIASVYSSSVNSISSIFAPIEALLLISSLITYLIIAPTT